MHRKLGHSLFSIVKDRSSRLVRRCGSLVYCGVFLLHSGNKILISLFIDKVTYLFSPLSLDVLAVRILLLYSGCLLLNQFLSPIICEGPLLSHHIYIVEVF
jgi:hypothetical protein